MSKLIKFCKDFAANEEGLTVVEYVIGAAMLVAAITVVFNGLGDSLETKLNDAIDEIS